MSFQLKQEVLHSTSCLRLLRSSPFRSNHSIVLAHKTNILPAKGSTRRCELNCLKIRQNICSTNKLPLYCPESEGCIVLDTGQRIPKHTLDIRTELRFSIASVELIWDSFIKGLGSHNWNLVKIITVEVITMMIQSGQNFAHVTQNCDLMGWLFFE